MILLMNIVYPSVYELKGIKPNAPQHNAILSGSGNLNLLAIVAVRRLTLHCAWSIQYDSSFTTVSRLLGGVDGV